MYKNFVFQFFIQFMNCFPQFVSVHVSCLTRTLINKSAFLEISLSLSIYLLVLSADFFGKQFGPGQDQQCIDPTQDLNNSTVMVSMREFFENVNLEKISKPRSNMQKYPECNYHHQPYSFYHG